MVCWHIVYISIAEFERWWKGLIFSRDSKNKTYVKASRELGSKIRELFATVILS